MTKLKRKFTDLFQESTEAWIDRDIIHEGDEIKIIDVCDGCDQPGCCPTLIRFTVPDYAELGILKGEVNGVTASEILEW